MFGIGGLRATTGDHHTGRVFPDIRLANISFPTKVGLATAGAFIVLVTLPFMSEVIAFTAVELGIFLISATLVCLALKIIFFSSSFQIRPRSTFFQYLPFHRDFYHESPRTSYWSGLRDMRRINPESSRPWFSHVPFYPSERAETGDHNGRRGPSRFFETHRFSSQEPSTRATTGDSNRGRR